MTANVITYRARSISRELGKVLGFPEAVLGRLAALLGGAEYEAAIPMAETAVRPRPEELVREAGLDPGHPQVLRFLEIAAAMRGLPRHLGQHSGGMVICRGALDRVVPLENASMPGRVVVQWDKDDCAALGMIKVDLLGLGMMAVLQEAIAIVNRGGDGQEVPGPVLDLAQLPPDDPAVFAMLRAADTIGVFQVESRAQMATLPRMRPECFYDLVIEVAIIRPGPIVGQMVPPFFRRRAGKEAVTYAHPALEPILKRTLGIPLFQEQLLRMAMAVAGFTGGEAEELRRALGMKRSADRRTQERMAAVEFKLRHGMAQQGIVGAVADEVVHAITSFALYGFPESHAASFALLVYASAFLKRHYPAPFYAALLNNQPMGFYHPATLVKDAERHGIEMAPVDIALSDWDCTVVGAEAAAPAPLPGLPSCPGRGVRLGLRYVSGLRAEVGRQVAAERRRAGFRSVEDLRRRSGLNQEEIRRLAEVGALAGLAPAPPPGAAGRRWGRRAALWQVERAWRPSGPLLEPTADRAGVFDARHDDQAGDAPALREMDTWERMQADYRGTGLTLGPHPMALRRAELQSAGVVTADELRRLPGGRRVRVAGTVIARQRPSTAGGILFVSLEDETGIANIIVLRELFERQRRLCATAAGLWVEGRLEKHEGVIHVRADRVAEMGTVRVRSYDFR